MAKKGGISEINGFVSVKNEDFKATPKKGVTEINQKNSTNVKKPSFIRTPVTQKLKQNDSSNIRSKPIGGSDTVKPKKVITTPQQNTKPSSVRDANLSKTKANVPSRPSRTTAPEPSKSSVTTKSSGAVPKAVPTVRKPVEKKGKPIVSAESSTSNVRREGNLSERKTESSVKPLRNNNTKRAVDSNSKRILKPTTIESKSKTNPKLVTSSTSRISDKPSVGTSKKPLSKETRDVTTIKISSTETTKTTIHETETYSTKEEITPNEINIKATHKDSLYFEIDMGTDKVKEKVLKEQDIVSAQPPPFSRQGTFTKDEDEEISVVLPVVAKVELEIPQSTEDDVYNYEDDFEDYESDFEEYVSESGVTSDSDSELAKEETLIKSPDQHTNKAASRPAEKAVEEEKKLDSGNYDLTPKGLNYTLPQSVKQKQLDQIKEAINRENSSYKERGKENVQIRKEEKPREVLDFISALERQDSNAVKSKKKNRSTLILERIKLHVQHISIFEEEFFYMDNLDPLYRNRNVAHAESEAAPIMRNEDIQTDVIRTKEKWTQCPIAFHKWSDISDPLKIYFEDQRGFGGDDVEIDLNSWMNPYYNPQKLYNFVESTGQVVLIMLEEEERWKSEGSVSVMKAKHDHGFSRGYIPLDTKKLHFLKSRPISEVLFSPHNENIFLSSHRFIKDIENLSSYEEQFLGRSILCLWNILEPSQPLSMFVASCQISAMSFDIFHSNLLFGGTTDGSVCLWDTNERSIYHMETVAGTVDYLLRTPSYCSSYLFGDDLHSNVIVSVQSLGYENSGHHSPETFIPTEVLTLDSDGKIILWVTVLSVSNVNSDFAIEKEDFGQPLWSKYKLVASRTLNPVNNLPSSQNTWSLQFLCMCLAPHQSQGVLVGTNTGSIVHCILSEEKPAVPVYSYKEEVDCVTSVLTIEKSPHQCPVYLAGCSNGTVRIHLMERKRPVRVLMMENQLRGSPICKIRWSQLGAGLFFVMDKNLSLHLWDLCKDESSPQITLALKKLKATHFDISSDNKFVYLAFVVHKERLEIHRLKEQFTPNTENGRDIDTFMSFIDKCFY